MRTTEQASKPFALAGRVSTEDQQDPETSRAWQLARAQALIEPHCGVIVDEFFDVGQSRAVPWKRRPRSAALLEAMKRPDRGFDAVVIGEPQRMFHGSQFSLTFPLFEHYGVELWVPEVGGAIDPGSDAHDMMMTLYGGMSKAERNRIKIRVRASMAAIAATEGRFLGGRPPYGYTLADAGPHPHPGKAAAGQRLHVLVPDPVTAPVVVRIFDEYLAGHGIFAIAERLTRDGIPCPSAYDRKRNPHRDGKAWSKSAVRAILKNPRYTGRQVWNRQRRDEVLLDVDDVAAGYVTKMRWNTEADWIWSSETVHEPIIPPETFVAAQRHSNAGGFRQAVRKPRSGPRVYPLSRRLRCGICTRRMEGSWNSKRNHYRCRYPSEYAAAKELEHPKSVYVREDEIVACLDAWLAELFAPESREDTIAALASADAATTADLAREAAARERIAECDVKLLRYREALEAGTEPALIARWTAEVDAERQAAESDLRDLSTRPAATPEQVAQLLDSLGDVLSALEGADPADKRDLYAELGVELTYHPADRTVVLEARPETVWGKSCVGGET